MKKSLIAAVAIVMSGLSVVWAGHFTDVLPPAATSGCMPVSNGYDYNCSTDSGAPVPTLNGATITGAVTQSGGVLTTSTQTANGSINLWSRTLAQLQTLTPSTTGQIVYCSNCTSCSVAVSSGSTAPYQWVTVSSNTLKTPCQ